jgi:hypothetical protein
LVTIVSIYTGDVNNANLEVSRNNKHDMRTNLDLEATRANTLLEGLPYASSLSPSFLLCSQLVEVEVVAQLRKCYVPQCHR